MLNEQNRSEFLENIAKKLGREVLKSPKPMDESVGNFEKTRLTNLSQDELCEEFINFSQIMTTKCVLTKKEDLLKNLLELCESYGGGPIIVGNDNRLEELQIIKTISDKYETRVWDKTLWDKNIDNAQSSKIGISFAEAGITETGGIVLFSSPDIGRAISLLPETSIVILRKSDILPRVAQMAQKLHKIAQDGKRMPSSINIIGGASSTADIELVKVWGVHGPIHVAYIILEDC